MLTGTIPSEWGRLTSLTWALTLHNNQLSGTIPTEISRLTFLQDLKLSGNELSGTIPTELGLLSSIHMLTLSNNALSGRIPDELSFTYDVLHTLSLAGNPLLSGIIPDSLCRLNGTCTSNILFQCDGNYGLSFDCTSDLCGCGCDCGSEFKNGTL